MGHGPRLDEVLGWRFAETPERVCAIDHEGHVLTYRDLWHASSSLAARLSQYRDAVGPIACGVGVLADTSLAGLVAYVACLQARVAYVSLDTLAPDALLEAQVSACFECVQLCTLLCDASGKEPALRLSTAVQIPVLALDVCGQVDSAVSGTHSSAAVPLPGRVVGRRLAADVSALAHVIFTSGTSSGRPRAVLTDHTASILSHAWRWPLGCSKGVPGPGRTSYSQGSSGDRDSFGDGTANTVVGCGVFGFWDAMASLLAGDGSVAALLPRNVRPPPNESIVHT